MTLDGRDMTWQKGKCYGQRARNRTATPRKVRAGPDMKPNHTDKPRPSGQRGLSALSSPKARSVVAQYGRFSLLVKLGLRKPLLLWSGLL